MGGKGFKFNRTYLELQLFALAIKHLEHQHYFDRLFKVDNFLAAPRDDDRASLVDGIQPALVEARRGAPSHIVQRPRHRIPSGLRVIVYLVKKLWPLNWCYLKRFMSPNATIYSSSALKKHKIFDIVSSTFFSMSYNRYGFWLTSRLLKWSAMLDIQDIDIF